MSDEPRYIPAAGRKSLARLYDPALALTVRERHFRSLLQDRVLDSTGNLGTVVDVGCGTGTFAIDLAATAPKVEVIGIDGDPDVLEVAKGKSGSEGVSWRRGLAGDLAMPDSSVDAVTMSLLLHHLAPSAKHAALSDAFRVLKPEGRLHIADWGQPHDPLMRGAFLLLQCLDGFDNTRDHAAGRLPMFVREANFGNVTSYERLRTVWGTLELIEASKAPAPGAA